MVSSIKKQQKNPVKSAVAVKTVKLASILLQQLSGQFSSNFAFAKNDQVSSNLAATSQIAASSKIAVSRFKLLPASKVLPELKLVFFMFLL